MDQTLFCPRLFDGETMRSNVLLHCVDGDVVSMAACPSPPASALRLPEDSIVSPGLLDIQVNGGGGAMFNDAPTVQAIERIAAAHRMQGTTALLPTLITDLPVRMGEAVDAVRLACAQVPGVLGVHLEGPFLRAEKRGIHRQELIAQFDATQDIARLTALGSAGKTLVTLAPECVPPGSVRALRERGALVFAGHSAASFELVQAALAEGLDGFTHLFNAMAPLSGRAPGVIAAALLAPSRYAGLVLDGHHVATASVALVRAARGFERIVLVSDAMPPAGTKMSSFILQGTTIRVNGGRCVDDAGILAGAAITLSDAVRIATSQYGFSVEEALASASSVPSRLLGLTGRYGMLRAGARADLVVWDAGLRPSAVMQGGHWVRAVQEAQ
ncbi:MAG: N-acetylglucosamine-6-phosphate deacetylase [Burkholderiaceae bacterium]